MTLGQGTSLGVQSNHDLMVQRMSLGNSLGIVQGFTIASTASDLQPVCTSGWINTPSGLVYIKQADLTTATASANTYYFFSVGGSTVGTVYTKTTYAPNNVDDICLGSVVATTTITNAFPGKWAFAQTVRLCSAGDLTATSGTYLGTVRYDGPRGYAYAQEAKITTTSTGSGTVTFEKIAGGTDTATALATAVSIGAVTAQTTTNTIAGRVLNISTTPVAVNPGDYLAVKTGTAAGAGKADLFVMVGGSPQLV